MPTIHLQVCAGFANRVRAMISGICLAEKLDMPLVIHWYTRSPECVCKFQSVLDPETLPKTVKVVPSELPVAFEVLNRDTMNKVMMRWDTNTDLLIKSHGVFYHNDRWLTHLRNLRPSNLVKDFLERRCYNVDWSKSIGVHIRRTDNEKSIRESPLDSFLNRMHSEKDAFFVVATDDKYVKEEIERKFLGRCLFPALVLSRHLEEGMIQGVADFIALSKCSRIFGSSGSSYGEIASQYGDKPIEIIKSE